MFNLCNQLLKISFDGCNSPPFGHVFWGSGLYPAASLILLYFSWPLQTEWPLT